MRKASIRTAAMRMLFNIAKIRISVPDSRTETLKEGRHSLEVKNMMHRTSIVILFILLTCTTAVGQTSYKGLTPGKSTKAQVQRVLGLPVTKVNETLFEYRPQPLTSKIYVQYGPDSVVEKIEARCRTGNSTCDDLMKSLNLHLPEPNSYKPGDAKWKLLYGSPLFIATSGDNAEVTGDTLLPSRLTFYSRELYEAEFVRVEEANAKAAEDLKKPPVPEPGQITGIVRLNGNPVAGATVDIYRTDLPPGHLQAKADRYGIFICMVFRGSYVVVVSGPGMKWTYAKGLNIPVAAALEIVAEPGDGTRPTQEQVMAAIR